MKRYFIDIETNALVAPSWRIYEANIGYDSILKDWYIICWTAKDIDTGKVIKDSVHLHPRRFKKDCRDDYEVVKKLAALLDGADVIVAHNGDKFDLKKINTRIIAHGLDAPSSYQSIDTLKIARQRFAFTSNRLDYLGQFLGAGRKDPTSWALWTGCAEGDIKAHTKMLKYNLQDVKLLEAVYKKLVPWLPGSKQFLGYKDPTQELCPACGSLRFIRWGIFYSSSNRYQRYRCKDCRSVFRDRSAMKAPKPRKVGI